MPAVVLTCNSGFVCEEVVVRFSHIAGDRFLDLVNTVDWRKSDEQRSDRLADFGDVLAWCQEAGLLTAGEATALATAAQARPGAARQQRDRVVEARELAYRALFDGEAAAAAALGRLHADALARAGLVLGEHGWAWYEHRPEALTTPGDRIVRGLVELGRRDDLERLHQCEDAACGWVFLDTSPRRNRRWCATDDCGDRNRSRAYYARRKATSSPGPAGSAPGEPGGR